MSKQDYWFDKYSNWWAMPRQTIRAGIFIGSACYWWRDWSPNCCNQSSQPRPNNLNYSKLCRSSRTKVLNCQCQVSSHAASMKNWNVHAHLHTPSPQTTHLYLASPQSFMSACVLISTFDGLTFSSRMACWVQSLGVKVLVTSSIKALRNAFRM